MNNDINRAFIPSQSVVNERVIEVPNYLSKSRLPVSDYVINPYVGCLHACKYCYACFMKRFTNHLEPWGEFLDVKMCSKPINLKVLEGKTVFLSSVTDCYNPMEQKYRVTRNILEQLVHANCNIGITTKSALILDDLPLLKKLKNLTVSISINTLDEKFRSDMDRASTIKDRLNALKIMHENGINVALFMSPMFPVLTDFKAIIAESHTYINTFWFENLNLRGSYKALILNYIKQNYPEIYPIYDEIYNKNDRTYWAVLAQEIEDYCTQNKIDHINYFYHELIRKP